MLTVGDKSESAGGNHADFDVVDVIELAFGGEELIELGYVRFFDVDDCKSLLACGNVGIGAGDVYVASVFEGDECIGERFWLREIGSVARTYAYVSAGKQ